ncbi:McrB family protein [Nocardia yamanashiensis]|uniref:McrB family protein n=1 Tax=Nocardia yamanashiensis TaxID=209247 RepID=UPI000832E3E2|nr:AAA family ATPase [Nocardia yamanashiensis]
MARIREIVPSTQNVRAHKMEDAVTCQYKVIDAPDGSTLVHLSTFGSEQRQSAPKSSQSMQLDRQNAAELIGILSEAFGFAWRPRHALAQAEEPAPTPTADVAPEFMPATDELATELYMPKAWLQECIDLLRERPQLIFYGPPGTGKTYLAKALANHLCGKEHVKMVQFHPTYSYEDFFEGFRPVETENGQIAYDIHRGPLRRIADDARKDPENLYALIIDEVNRGNLSKIFGELYYLLEYRDESINLLYSDKTEMFTLPKNVLIIGTMNRADRSVALVDTAMRRRFRFVHLHPSKEPTKGMLREWLKRNNEPRVVAAIVEELNELILDEDFKIGPSFFMRPYATSRKGMDIVWSTEVLPLLEEYHFGDSGVDVQETYSLSKIRERVGDPVTADGEE